MECPGEQELVDFAGGQLAAPMAALVRSHLAGCLSCESRAQRISPSTAQHAPVDYTLVTQAPSARRPTHALQPGTRVGRYLVISVLGVGGMGEVYAAFDPELDRKVALKLLHSRFGAHDAGVWQPRLVREAQAMARLADPNVVTVYDVGLSAGRLFVAMEYVDGGTARQWLASTPRPSLAKILALFAAAGRGLAAAHKAGLVHRDFKPDNVLIGKDGRVHVTDFGLARIVCEGDAAAGEPLPPATPLPPGASALDVPLTGLGTVMGTPGYMAPEQYRAQRIDARTDQFSFCAALYEALYGERPFAGDNRDQIEAATLAGRVGEPRGSARVPAWLRRVLVRGLAAEQERRYPSMDALLAALAADPRARLRRLGLLAGVTAALALALAGYSYAGARRLRACQTGRARLAGVWDGPRRRAGAAAFAASGLPYGADVWRGVERTLDGYTDAWVAMHDDALAATRLRGEQSKQMLAARLDCLDARLDEVDALASNLLRADALKAQKASEATQSLTSLDGCAEVDELAESPKLPADPVARALVRQAHATLLQGRTKADLGSVGEGLQLAQAAVADARKVDYPPLLADALASLGAIQETHHDQEATATMKEALLFAESNRLERAKVEAQLGLALTLGYDATHYQEGHEWLKSAAATLHRLHRADDLAARRAFIEGWIYNREEKWPESIASMRQAIALSRQTSLASGFMVARAHSALGLALVRLVKLDEAMQEGREAIHLGEALLGRDNPKMDVLLLNYGAVVGDAHHPAESIEYSKRALEARLQRVAAGDVKPDDPALGFVAENIGNELLTTHRYAEAIDYATRARAAYVRAFGAQTYWVGRADGLAAISHLRLGHRAESRLLFERALQNMTGPDMPVDVLGRLLSDYGELDLVDKQPARAAERARRALALYDGKSDVTPDDVAAARFVLARALYPANPAEGRRQAALARAAYRASHNGDLAEVDAWFAAIDARSDLALASGAGPSGARNGTTHH